MSARAFRSALMVSMIWLTASCSALLGVDLDALTPQVIPDAAPPDGLVPSGDARATSSGSNDSGTSSDSALDGMNTPPISDEGGASDRRYPQWPVAPNSISPSVYTVTTDTVEDAVTGLVWQRTAPEDRMKRDEAGYFCSKLVLGGHDDWRLPTRIELISIVDFGRTASPKIAPVFAGFQDVPMVAWTSSALGANEVFDVDFHDGIVTWEAEMPTAFVRCVRGGKVARGPRWTRDGGIAKDNFTGLEWSTSPVDLPATVDPKDLVAEAKRRCSTLVVTGTAFRLPTIRELHTIVDEQVTANASTLDRIFGSTVSAVWSSTQDTADVYHFLYFPSAYSSPGLLSGHDDIRAALCVR